jgi:hypothetical protein
MKNLIITEQERKRILGMHKSATSNHYLMEQDDEYDDLISKTSPKSRDVSKNQTNSNQSNSNQSNSNYKNSNDSFEDKDDMINKSGSGKKIVAVVDANIKNNTKKSEEIVKLKFSEDQFANDYLGDPDLAPSTKDILKDDYGYAVWGFADKTKYSVGDSISITATIPLELGNSTIERNKGNINLATKSNSGNNTTIQISGSIVEDVDRIYPIRIRYDVNEESPFGPKKQLTFYIAFK